MNTTFSYYINHKLNSVEVWLPNNKSVWYHVSLDEDTGKTEESYSGSFNTELDEYDAKLFDDMSAYANKLYHDYITNGITVRMVIPVNNVTKYTAMEILIIIRQHLREVDASGWEWLMAVGGNTLTIDFYGPQEVFEKGIPKLSMSRIFSMAGIDPLDEDEVVNTIEVTLDTRYAFKPVALNYGRIPELVLRITPDNDVSIVPSEGQLQIFKHMNTYQ